jgi:hypothetical protein
MCGGNSGVHVMQNCSESTSKLWMEMPSKEADAQATKQEHQSHYDL